MRISMNELKTGLVLEGGAMRGLFTAGILDVFMENGVTFDSAVGVSAGAAFGCNLKSGQAGRALRYNKKYCNDKRYVGFGNLIRTGNIFGVDFCYDELPKKLDVWDMEGAAKNPMEFYAVVTNCKTAEPEYYLCNSTWDDLDWIRASASMPVVSKPVEIKGNMYLDGALSDCIPLKFMQKKGAKKIVVIETRPDGYEKKKDPKVIMLSNVMLRKYPVLVKKFAKQYQMYNETKKYIKEQELKGNVLVLRPKSDLGIKRVEKHPKELQRVYDIGRELGLERLEEIQNYLK